MLGGSQSPITDAHAKIKHLSSRGKPVSSPLQPRLSWKRPDENIYPHSSRWPNLTQRRRAPVRSFLDILPTPSSNTLKIMRKTIEDACPPVPLQKKATEKSDLNEEKWADINSWWRHLSRV